METNDKAQFKALRETVGLSQRDMADILGIEDRTVRRWENPNDVSSPSEAAWRLLEDSLERMNAQIDFACEICEEGCAEVVLTYYRDQQMFDEHGRDEGMFGQANATSRGVAQALRNRGIAVRFAYPEHGAVRTPGSRY